MGQELSLSEVKVPDIFSTSSRQSNELLSTNETENVHLFLPFEIINELNKNSILLKNQKISNELSIAKETLVDQIRNDLSISSNLSEVTALNTDVTEMIKKVLDYITAANSSLQNSIESIMNKQNQLKNSYAEKLKDDENKMTSIFSEPFIDSEKVSDEQQIKELSYFAIQSLLNMLLMLLQSVHKSDSVIPRTMLNLTNQIVEQMPLNSLSSDVYKGSHSLFKSLQPLTNYIQELSIQTDIDPIVAKQSINILLNFSVIKSSFKDILPLIRKLIFNINDTFDVRKLLIKLNQHLTMMIDKYDKEKQKSLDTTTTLQNDTTDSIDKIQDRNIFGKSI